MRVIRMLAFGFVGTLSYLGIACVTHAQGQEMVVSTESAEPLDFRSAPAHGPSGGTIRGTVLDSSTGLPVRGLRVEARHATIPGAGSATTSATGFYEMTINFDGDWFVYAGGPASTFDQFLVGQLYPGIECVDPGEVCDFTTGDPITLSGGNLVEDIDFSLIPGGAISGEFLEATTGYDANDFPEINIFDSDGDLYARLSSFYTVMRYSSGVRIYLTDALPVGSYYVGSSSPGLVDQVYPDLDCANLGCDVTAGDLVPVTVNTNRSGTDFHTTVDPAQGGAIAGSANQRSVVDAFPIGRVEAWDPATQSRVGARASSARSYLLAGVPAGVSARVIARDFGYFNELYDDIRCEDGGNPPCDLNPGNPVLTTAGGITDDIDFCLESNDEMFRDSFECGDTSAWSLTFP